MRSVRSSGIVVSLSLDLRDGLPASLPRRWDVRQGENSSLVGSIWGGAALGHESGPCGYERCGWFWFGEVDPGSAGSRFVVADRRIRQINAWQALAEATGVTAAPAGWT
jgi:hypothetical protein